MNILKILLPFFATSILSATSVSSLYMHKCSGCHGQDGENTVLGKSKVIHKMTVVEIEEAIYNYAAGTRKTNTMIRSGKEAIVSNYSKEQIHALAVYISEL